MATVLYITAHPLDPTRSYSLSLGEAFLDNYRADAPDDEIVHLDLYRMDVPAIDLDVFEGWGKLRTGQSFEQLTPEQQRKVGRLNELADQFVAAAKYVFVTPMWNLSFPPILKAYIDAVCVAGKTFKYTESGPVGLLTGRKGLHIQARGGVYSEGPAADLEFGHKYLAAIMRFLGVTDFEGLFVEGHAYAPDRAEQIKLEAIARSVEVARRFATPVREVAHT